MVPQLVRIREVKVGSRLEDRFSQQLRLVAPESAPVLAEHAVRSPLHRTIPLEGRTMIRPTAPESNRVNARELAATRAARAAEISRRAAAARRRALVLTILSAVTVAVMASAIWGPLAWGWAFIPGALLGGMGYVSVGAERTRRRADARARAEMHRLDQRLRLFRKQEAAADAGAAGDANFDELVSARADEAQPDSEEDAAPRHVRDATAVESDAVMSSGGEPILSGDAGWSPVPVPPPTYTLKQQAPRRSVPAYQADEPQQDEASGKVPVRPTAAAPSSGQDASPALDVTKALARRRAAGM